MVKCFILAVTILNELILRPFGCIKTLINRNLAGVLKRMPANNSSTTQNSLVKHVFF